MISLNSLYRSKPFCFVSIVHLWESTVWNTCPSIIYCLILFTFSLYSSKVSDCFIIFPSFWIFANASFTISSQRNIAFFLPASVSSSTTTAVIVSAKWSIDKNSVTSINEIVLIPISSRFLSGSSSLYLTKS